MPGGDNRPVHVKMRAADQQAAVLAARRQGVQPHEIAEDATIWGADAVPVSVAKVNTVWRTALRRITQPEADLARAKLRDELDALRAVAWGVLRRKHVVVSGGAVVREGAWVRVPDKPTATDGADLRQVEDGSWEVWDEHAGEPLQDSGPVLAAVVELRKLMEAEARLFGLNLPVRVELGGDVNVTYRIQGVDVGDVR